MTLPGVFFFSVIVVAFVLFSFVFQPDSGDHSTGEVFCGCYRLATVQAVTFRLRVMVLAEEGYGKIQVHEPARRKDTENKEQTAEKAQEGNE